MSLRLRQYRDQDLLQIKDLTEQLGYPSETDTLQENIIEIQKRGGEIIVAEENEEVVGSVCIIIDVRLAEGLYAEIVSLVVDSGARRKGIGKALIQSAEVWARKHVSKVRVRANTIREDAHSFYKSLGYECVKEQKVFKKYV